MSSIWTLRRSATDSKISGLCGGVADHWGVDPVLVRVGCALLALSGGVGAVLYLAGWLLIPVEGKSASPADDLLGAQVRRWPREAWIAIVIGACILSFFIFGAVTPFGIGPAILLAVIWYFGFYRNRQRADRGPIEPTPAPTLSPYANQPSTPSTPFTEAAEAWRLRMEEHARQVAALRSGASAPTAAAGPFPQWPTAPTTRVGAPTVSSPSPAGAPAAPWPPADRPTLAEPTIRGGFGAGYPATGSPYLAGESPAQPSYAIPSGATPVGASHDAFLAEADPVGLYTESPAAPVVAPIRRGRTPAARRLRLIGLIVLGLTLAGLGLANYSGIAVPLAAYFGAALLVVGLTLVAAAWFGRARGLLGLGVLLLVGLLAASAIPSGVQRADWAEATRTYSSAGQLPTAGDELDVGRMTVDLRQLSYASDTTYQAHVDLGTLTVLAPADANLRLEYAVDRGTVQLLDKTIEAGSNLQGTADDTPAGSTGRPTLTLKLSVDSGRVTVRR